MITADRYHDISVGHRVHGHEGKCQHLHGHNYRVHFKVAPIPIMPLIPETDAEKLDDVGRVLDFSVIKSKLCMWLEENWDHKFIAWEEDVFMAELYQLTTIAAYGSGWTAAMMMFVDSIVWVPFNPTAENMGLHLLNKIGPAVLEGTHCQLVEVVIEETRKCSVSVKLEA